MTQGVNLTHIHTYPCHSTSIIHDHNVKSSFCPFLSLPPNQHLIYVRNQFNPPLSLSLCDDSPTAWTKPPTLVIYQTFNHQSCFMCLFFLYYFQHCLWLHTSATVMYNVNFFSWTPIVVFFSFLDKIWLPFLFFELDLLLHAKTWNSLALLTWLSLCVCNHSFPFIPWQKKSILLYAQILYWPKNIYLKKLFCTEICLTNI